MSIRNYGQNNHTAKVLHRIFRFLKVINSRKNNKDLCGMKRNCKLRAAAPPKTSQKVGKVQKGWDIGISDENKKKRSTVQNVG